MEAHGGVETPSQSLSSVISNTHIFKLPSPEAIHCELTTNQLRIIENK